MNRTSDVSKNSEVLTFRTTKRMMDLIRATALQENISVSDFIKQTIAEYFNRRLTDSEILHQTLNENTRHIKYLEDKTELMAYMVLGMVKEIKKSLNPTNLSRDIIEEEMKVFEKNCFKSLKNQHPGKLSQMVMDIYEEEASPEESEEGEA